MSANGKEKIIEYLKSNILVTDGAMGTYFASLYDTKEPPEYCNIKELADRLHKSEKYVVKDLKKMISKGWFTQGYLDGQETCLMTSREMYESGTK